MLHSPDIFGPGSNVKHRFIPDHAELLKIVEGVRQTRKDLKIVMTLGSYDLLHIGHCRYLEQAKNSGAVVIVGLDCDEAIKMRKGPRRPTIPQEERIEMLSHLRHVDLVTLDSDFIREGERKGHTKFSLIKSLKPDIFIASERSYDEDQLTILKENSGNVVVFPSQAETSTSAKLRLFIMEVGAEAKQAIDERLDRELPQEATNMFSKHMCEIVHDLGNIAKEAIDKKLEELKP